jgi:hypothetical protein
LHREKRARPLHWATALVSADIAQDRKSCQFAFLLDEKSAVVSALCVSAGDGVSLSIELFDNQAHREENPANV